MVNHPASRGQNWKSGEPIDFIVQINFSEVFGVEKIGADKNSIKFDLRLSSKNGVGDGCQIWQNYDFCFTSELNLKV